MPSTRLRRVAARGLLAVGIGLAALLPGLASAQADDQHAFPDTGYTIADDAVWTFFSQHGGVGTFGEPISREFDLSDLPTQLFENAALQVEPDGSVQALALGDPSLVPASQLGGLTPPAADPALAMVTPSPDQPNYPARLAVFLQATVPDSWNGQPVQLFSTFSSTGGTDVWGLPTSAPAADPHNPHFVYQRFQNGILMYDATAGTTQPLPLGEYLAHVLASQGVTDAFTPELG